MNHTPGPWGIQARYGVLHDEIGVGDRALAFVWTRKSLGRKDDHAPTTEPWPEGEANARLIAAAPELLIACKALQMEAKARGCGLRIADEAIAKAEGHTA